MMRNRGFPVCFVFATGIVFWLCTLASGQVPGASAEDAASRVSVFDHFVRQGGAITWFVLIPMSVAMVAMSIHQFLLIRRSALMPPRLREDIVELAEQKRSREVLELTEDEPSMLGFVVHAGVSEVAHGHEAVLHTLEGAAEERVATLLRKLEHLNVLGSVAPMVGLFGTVYGMIRAFHSLVETGGVPDPAKLAYGISVALVTTFWGLLVAIPALAVFAISRNRLDVLAPECVLLADDVLRPLVERGESSEALELAEAEV